jgi:hypothetical protein
VSKLLTTITSTSTTQDPSAMAAKLEAAASQCRKKHLDHPADVFRACVTAQLGS